MASGPSDSVEKVRDAVDAIYRSESRRVLATLIRVLGDFELAEEALHDAFAAAVEQWSRDGVPANPRAWLVSAGRFKAIDAMRRRARFDASLADLAKRLDTDGGDPAGQDDDGVEDDRLRLIFTCCHPALSPEARVALTLREVCGLTTEELARAFLTAPPTVAQRIVRAKAKIRDARIPYQVPGRADLPGRLEGVLQVIYLVFNEGYSASSGGSLTRADLSGEAIRLGRLLVELLPDPEALGLLALMLLHESRRVARTTREGDLVLLDRQDRSLWNREFIAEGRSLVQRALASAGAGGVRAPGGDIGRSRRRPRCRRDRLGADRGLVRGSGARDAFARGRAEPRRRRGHARRARGGACACRRPPGARRPDGLPPGTRGAGRPVPTPGKKCRRPRRVPSSARSYPARAGAAVPRAPARRVVGLNWAVL